MCIATDKNEEKEKKAGEYFDIVESNIGTLGSWQKCLCILIALVKIPVAWHQLSYTFLAAEMEFSCVDNTTEKCSDNCSSHVFDRSIFTETIITQWDLVCGKSSLAAFSQTITMLGILVGNITFGYLSDRYGRRNPLIWAVILQGLTGIIMAVVPWFYIFLLMRFLLACTTGGTMITSFVLLMETIGLKWRTTMGVLYHMPFIFGHFTLPVISYFLRDWRYLQMVISVPSLFLVVYYCLLPESPRYLLASRQNKEAVEVMTKAAKRNKLPTEHITNSVNTYIQKLEISQEETQTQVNVLDLVKTHYMRINTMCMCFNWLSCGLCFFGVAYYIGTLAGNIFINVAISALIQIPSNLSTLWCVKALGRRKTLLIANILAGLSILLIVAIPDSLPWLRTFLSTIAMFGLTIVFPTIYIYSGELFPTTVRNIGIGTASMCARVGSMTAPHIVTLGMTLPWSPPVLFSIGPLVSAVLCLKLPETLDCKLPDTVEEMEEFCRNAKNKDTEKLQEEATVNGINVT